MADEIMACPFCGWKAVDGEYAMLLHLETLHAEGQSPFVPMNESDNGSIGAAAPSKSQAGSNNDDDAQYVACPVDGCGEVLLLEEMDFHIEMHAEEAEGDEHSESQIHESTSEESKAVDENAKPSPAAGPSRSHRKREREREKEKARDRDRDRDRGRERRRSHSPVEEAIGRQAKAIQAWKNLLHMPSPKRRPDKSVPSGSEKTKRLGKAQLGKYAHEDRMPDWLVAHLEKGVMVNSEGMIPVLAQLLEQSSSTEYAYLCHPCVQHVSKLRKEGGFCGYRNIQTVSSYMIGTNFPGSKPFNGKIPTIFQIQDFIESAWDQGISAQGREETGGIKGTRKYIGTPEALAMFRLLNIPCDAQGFRDQTPGKSEALLMEDVENYFQLGVMDPQQRVRRTKMPPVYFQHAGHSMTIVGLERLKSGERNLLVFDPMFHDTKAVMKLVGKQFEHRFPEMPLKSYRRGSKYLKKYREFEVLKLRLPSEDFLFDN